MLMVQSNAHPMKSTKIKGPPPVPPRPSQSMVAEALAKTRKAVADSKATIKTRTFTKNEIHHVSSKAKTLDRNSTPTKPSVSPRQNGLARVKSFIRDVISDRSSSSDDKKSSGHNSRRSSSDSSTLHSPTSNKSSESLNSKAVKTCKQILVRSLSTSNKLDQDPKCKVSKSSSFAEKTLPLRKAPPPPLSPKPKLKPLKPLPVQKTIEQKKPLKQSDSGIYALPVDAQPPPKSPIPDECYATVEEVNNVEDRLQQNSSPKAINNHSDTQYTENQRNDVTLNKNNNNNSLERKTSRVTEMLISEILASRNNNKGEANAVIDKGKDSTNPTNGNDTPEADKMKDMNNHEMLIYELQTMRSQSNVPEGVAPKENDDMQCDSEDDNYATASIASDHNVEDDQAYAYIRDDDLKSRLRKQFKAISTMSLQGLPPLPKSLSGFADGEPDLREPSLTPAEEHPPTDLDSQLVYLKKEMDLAKLGADITGIDASKHLIEVAIDHSRKNKRLADNLPTYITTTIEDHSIKYPDTYDAIVCSEVIEHVTEKELFVESCVRATKPGGKLFFTTPNRTRFAQLYLIYFSENVLRNYPKGAHHYDKFMRPNELQYMLELNDCSVESIKGYFFYPGNIWEWTKTKMFSFATEAVKLA